MTTPRVSILMPVYNVAPYLREAMDSILAQTFLDFELIVLDDCSPDNSAEILDTYTDERIVRYRGEKNMGLSNVLNVGMAMARGELIARMDSDDISTPERLATQVAYLDAHPEVDLCSCGMELFGAKQETWVRETNVEDVKITALFHSPILHASSVWRRASFERVGLRFLQEMVPAEDYDMWTRAMAAGLKLVNIPEVMYHYRIHPSQATTQTDKTAKKDREVKANYLRMLYPTEDMSAVNLLPAQSASDLERIKQSVAHLLEANKRTPFFEQVRLEKRMWNYYYRQVVNCLAVHFEWRLVGELSWKWRIKWLLRK
jgi:glycosyltransferase involved in cell wall biosynthesis